MKRWHSSIQKQYDVLNKRIAILVGRLVYVAQRAKRQQNSLELNHTKSMQEKLDRSYEKMVDIVTSLLCVEDMVKSRWPQVTELFDSIKYVIDHKKESIVSDEE